MQYAPTVLPKNTVRFLSPTRTRSTSLASVEALIFFCLLFFHQGKKRRSGHGGEAPIAKTFFQVGASEFDAF